MQSLLQRIKHEPRMRRTADTPADDPARKGIDDEGDINKASLGRDMSKVRDPQPVRRHNPIRTHQARNGTTRDTETFST
jgi:hypothetical protein